MFFFFLPFQRLTVLYIGVENVEEHGSSLTQYPFQIALDSGMS